MTVGTLCSGSPRTWADVRVSTLTCSLPQLLFDPRRREGMKEIWFSTWALVKATRGRGVIFPLAWWIGIMEFWGGQGCDTNVASTSSTKANFISTPSISTPMVAQTAELSPPWHSQPSPNKTAVVFSIPHGLFHWPCWWRLEILLITPATTPQGSQRPPAYIHFAKLKLPPPNSSNEILKPKA